MDSKGLLGRVKSILLTPKEEWPVIAAEPATAAGIYTGYILLLAAVPAVCTFLKLSVFGYSLGFLGTMHAGAGVALSAAIRVYLDSIIGTIIVAFIVNALAPSFGGQKNGVQALKVVAYSYTASWVAGIAALLGAIGILIFLLGLGYGIYLLYLGLPPTMKCPPEKAGGYTLVTLICAILIGWVLFYVLSAVLGLRQMGMSGMTGSQITIERDGIAGKKLGEWAQGMAAAGKDLEAAEKSGEKQAEAKAVGEMMSGVANGGQQVEALTPDRLKNFLPDTLGGLKRTDASAERNGAMGMQVATAAANYADESGGRSLKLEITDLGGAKGLLAAATHANVEQDRETSTGYEKTYHQGGTMMHEQWDNSSSEGEYSAVVADRFMVKVAGKADNINALKNALGTVDMTGLAALKNEGVKAN
jgi:hypothetical protein